MVGVHSGSLYRRTHSLSSGLVLGWRPLVAVLHFIKFEPGELSQWLCRDDSAVNIVLDVIIIVMHLYLWMASLLLSCVKSSYVVLEGRPWPQSQSLAKFLWPWARDLWLGMCGIDYFKFWFWFGFQKPQIWYRMSLVQKTRFGSDITVITAITHVIADGIVYGIILQRQWMTWVWHPGLVLGLSLEVWGIGLSLLALTNHYITG